MDADGFVRNTYLLRIINKDAHAEAVEYQVALEGLEGAEVLTDVVVLESNTSRTLPLIVRVPAAEVDARSVPIQVRVSAPSGEVLVPTTFATGGSVGAAPSPD
jgi:hypothetical protein